MFRQCRNISGKLVPNPDFWGDCSTELENIGADSIIIHTNVRNWLWYPQIARQAFWPGDATSQGLLKGSSVGVKPVPTRFV